MCTKNAVFLIAFLNHNNLNLTVSTLEYTNKETVGVQHLLYACILSCLSAIVSFYGSVAQTLVVLVNHKWARYIVSSL